MKKFKASSVVMFGIVMGVFCLVGCAEKDTWLDHLALDDPILGGEVEEDLTPWIGTWNMTTWFEQDDTGAITEEEDAPGFITYNDDGSCSCLLYDFEAEGTYEVVDDEITHDFDPADDWWNGPWILTIDGDEMTWFTGDPGGAGEGYKFEAD